MAGTASAANVTVFTDFSAWASAAGAYNLENFNDQTLLPDLSFTTNAQGAIHTGGYFQDVANNNVGTTWTFANTVHSLGGTWDLATPGGQGSGLKLTMSGGTETFSTPEILRSTNGFWGFVSDTGFSSVFVTEGTQSAGQETYHLDNMVYAPVPLPGAIWLLGSGLAGLALRRRRESHT